MMATRARALVSLVALMTTLGAPAGDARAG